MPPLPGHALQAVHHCRSKGLWLRWCLCFSSTIVQRTFLYERNWHVGLKALCMHQLDFSMFDELWLYFGVLQQPRVLLSVYREKNIVLATGSIVWEFSLANNSIRCCLITGLKTFGDKSWPIEVLSPRLFVQFHFHHLSICMHFKNLLPY